MIDFLEDNDVDAKIEPLKSSTWGNYFISTDELGNFEYRSELGMVTHRYLGGSVEYQGEREVDLLLKKLKMML